MTRVSRLRFIDVDRTRMPVRKRIRPRGVPNALAGHPVACTDDLSVATDVTRQLLGPSHLALAPEHRDGFLATLNAVQFLDVTMAYLDYAVPTDLTVTASPDCYTVHMTTSGQAQVQVEGRHYELSAFFALVVSPKMGYRMHLEADSPQMVVRIERQAMEGQLSRMLGRSLDDRLRFEPVSDLTTDAASRWTGALNILSAEVMAPDSLTQQGVGAGSLEELVISTLLYLQPSNYSERLRHAATRSGRPAVTRSIRYIEEHLAEPITLADLARCTEMSPRSIQAGFRQDLGTTPVAFIRERRLQQVRRALMEALPGDGVNVTDVAQRWGFSHLGHFSVTYRQRFGESPSATLRR